MTPQSHRPDDGNDVAPQHVQDEISELLQHAAQQDGPSLRMPGHVEARLRDALDAERARSRPTENATSTGAPPTVVPLPMRRSPAPQEDDSTQAAVPYAATPRHEVEAPAQSMSDREGASVSSLSEHRSRRKGLGKAALALGAAAAVAIGAVAVTSQMNNKSDGGSVAAQSPAASSASGDQGAQSYASRVRVTQTQTQYTSASLKDQAAALPTSSSPAIQSVTAEAQSLGPLATEQGVKSCLAAVNASVKSAPDKIYADFGTYEGKKAVIVVTVKGKEKTAWVVSRTCSKGSDKLAGPETIST